MIRDLAREYLIKLVGPEGAELDMNASVMAAVTQRLETLITQDAVQARYGSRCRCTAYGLSTFVVCSHMWSAHAYRLCIHVVCAPTYYTWTASTLSLISYSCNVQTVLRDITSQPMTRMVQMNQNSLTLAGFASRSW